MLTDQVIQQRNLLLEYLGGGVGTHGELASRRRIRLAAGKSQARMVGALKKLARTGQRDMT